MTDYAHSVKGSPKDAWETLKDHSIRVANAAAAHADAFGGADMARMLGMLHDIGKMKPAFQKRLEDDRIKASHAGEGARFMHAQNQICQMFAAVIAGHHGALPNPDRLEGMVARAEQVKLPDWCTLPTNGPLDWLPKEFATGGNSPAFKIQFLVRMLYSCLTDADHVETGAFYDGVDGRTRPARDKELNTTHQVAFDAHIKTLKAEGEVGKLRQDVLRHVRAQAPQKPGLFSLTVPTGGGKTLTSLGFGLDHALHHGLRRLIYVIPYTSIIEQTAQVFRKVLGDDAVLEHHSAFDIDTDGTADQGDDKDDEAEFYRMASASWDMPVVVTTSVQFFESLFAARKKRCRKLHSLARSVIVLDEAQTLPLGLLRPCLAALTELMQHYGATVVLCTATQPALTAEQGFPTKEALTGNRNLAPDEGALFAWPRRTRVRYIEQQTDAALVGHMREAHQALLIVDNRMQARGLFDHLRDAEGTYHLSTLMTAAHRRAVLDEVRERLKAQVPTRLISTSLIEAGVDISFPLVLRAAAGIDSIAQAAGRCNRNGELPEPGEVRVFAPEHEPPEVIRQFAALGREVLKKCKEKCVDPISPEAVSHYFRRLSEMYGKPGLDVAEVGKAGGARIQGILNAITDAPLGKCPYEDIADAFRLIPEGQKTLIIRGGAYGIQADALEDIRFGGPGRAARAFQGFLVSVPHGLWCGLWAAGAISWWEEEKFDQQFAMLEHQQLYDERAGLAIEGLDTAGGVI